MFRKSRNTFSNIEKEDSGAFSENLIRNGNMEKQFSTAAIKDRLKLWIDSGCDFYNNDDLLLPSYSIITSHWAKPNSNNYTKIYSDVNNPINGIYSLHVSFPKNARGILYLLNKIPKVSGILSFKLKMLKHDTPLFLNFLSYQDNKPTTAEYIHYILFNDNQIHHLSFNINTTSISGEEILFYIIGKESEFLIDDIVFTPYPD